MVEVNRKSITVPLTCAFCDVCRYNNPNKKSVISKERYQTRILSGRNFTRLERVRLWDRRNK